LISDRASERGQACEYVLEQARSGQCELWTSSFCLAEVFKRKCDGALVGLAEENDTYFEDLIEQEFIHKVSGDVDVGKVARRLLRKFPTIGKPQDAVHVATCLLNDVDQLHTYDRDDLIRLSGQLDRLDRQKLVICPPPDRPEEQQVDMFKGARSQETADAKPEDKAAE
jgi:predicted nucleic acid-binding protein